MCREAYRGYRSPEALARESSAQALLGIGSFLIERTVIVIGAVDTGENRYPPRSVAVSLYTGDVRSAGTARALLLLMTVPHCVPTSCPRVFRTSSTILSTPCERCVIPARELCLGDRVQLVRACCLIRVVSSVTCVNTDWRSAISLRILRSALMTVVWSRPPNC
jgi:hypothetical protein